MKNLETFMKARLAATGIIKGLAELSPTLANWTYHPRDQNTLVDLESKDTLVGYTMSIQDSKFILFCYHNYKLIVRTLQVFDSEIDDLLVDADANSGKMRMMQADLSDLQALNNKMRGIIAGLTTPDLLIQGEALKQAEIILSETGS